MSKRILLGLAMTAMVLSACGGDQGGGSLQAIIDEAGETTGYTQFANGVDKSFGVFVCSNGGSVEIESLEPLHTEGDIEFLGGRLYTSSDRFVGAADGFPPNGIDEDELEPLAGAVVDSDCDSPEGDERVQILAGASRTGAGGGIIDGLTVATSGGTLEIPLTILLCGDDMQYCDVLVPEGDG
jgi:hypothetical protein